jgi:hypothetical protein
LIPGQYSVMTLASEAANNMKAFFGTFISSILILLNCNVVAYECASGRGQSEVIMQDQPTGCEYNSAVLDGLAQRTQPDELIIVIARLGSRERRPNLNDRRLQNVRTYLTEFLRDPTVRRNPKSIILAQGERVQGLGRIEFYISGKLVRALTMRTNADLTGANCAREPHESPCPPSLRHFYPCKDRYPR